MSDHYIPHPEWQEGIPDKSIKLVIIDYDGDYEFGYYNHTIEKWRVFAKGAWVNCAYDVERWHLLAPM